MAAVALLAVEDGCADTTSAAFAAGAADRSAWGWEVRSWGLTVGGWGLGAGSWGFGLPAADELRGGEEGMSLWSGSLLLPSAAGSMLK